MKCSSDVFFFYEIHWYLNESMVFASNISPISTYSVTVILYKCFSPHFDFTPIISIQAYFILCHIKSWQICNIRNDTSPKVVKMSEWKRPIQITLLMSHKDYNRANHCRGKQAWWYGTHVENGKFNLVCERTQLN